MNPLAIILIFICGELIALPLFAALRATLGPQSSSDIEDSLYRVLPGEPPSIRIVIRDEAPDPRCASLFNPLNERGLPLLKDTGGAELPDEPARQKDKNQ